MDLSLLLPYGLGLLSVGLVVYVAYPYLTGGIQAERRREAMTGAGRTKRGDRPADMVNRRKQVADSLKEIDQREKRRVSLEHKIGQAGLEWTKQTYYVISASLGLGLGAIVFLVTANPLIAVPAVMVGAFGLPNWYIGFRRKRRMAKFLYEFPNAVDVIVRGVKAGLPLGDCLRMIANEAAEPVRSEFRHIIEAQAIGLSMSEAVDRIVDRVPVPEANFFAIVISIQSRAGGNLSEALGNLSRVLRDRKKMKAKVKAVSSEATSSAMIIGAMPFAVGLLVYVSSPRYIELLWTTSTGRLAIAAGLFWMSVGIAVMRKMINFDI